MPNKSAGFLKFYGLNDMKLKEKIKFYDGFFKFWSIFKNPHRSKE